ncbi:MAG: GDSL-type esterase/lipase family protein [Elusimicrobia bacterium]|nr:GDSL-type esterase/lipase family protein [Elusimicrobiota bacterium]
MRRSWLGPILLTVLLLGAAELVLRALGFRYAHYPVSMRYVGTLAHLGADQTLRRRTFHIDYRLDRELLWRPVATAGVTNSAGFLGPEWIEAKPADAVRVIALGDSCTVAGEDPYPARLAGLLGALPGGRRWEVWNAGVGSWSSYQGLKLLETELLRYKPDIVTIYFGWNDHWLAWAAPDKDLAALLDRQSRVLRLVERSRLAQGLLYLADACRGGPKFSARTPPRVALRDYASNLAAMVRLIRSAGAEAVLLTAPTVLTPEHPVTLSLCRRTRNFFDPARIGEVHESYNEAVRSVARRTGAPLADLASEFARAGRPGPFFTDGIHLTAAGHRRAAELLAVRVRRAVMRRSP